MKYYIAILIGWLLLPSPSRAYDDGIRIAWDYNQRVFLNAGTYARIVKLTNNDLALVYSYGADVYIRKQTAGNKYWDEAVLVARDGLSAYNYTNAEMIELENGALVYGWNARPKDGTNKPYKIMIKFSNDGGKTWQSEQDVYTAGTTAEEGCWEPYFLQLPSGELQIYFANEHNVTNRYQNITMMRSADNGATWRLPEIVSYRAGARDGMPVAVNLQNGKGIAMAIEDNGINGAFKPVIVHTDADDNWVSGTVYGNSSKRWHALRSDYRLSSGVYGGAPYLIQLASGETVLAFQSQEGRTNGSSHEYANMQVYIGDDSAKDFSRKSTPFPTLALTSQALWNSLSQVSDSTVTAIASLSGLSADNGVWSATGRILRPMESPLAETGNRDWTKAVPLFIGSESRAGMEIRSMWDNDSLYFHFDVNDIKLYVAGEGSALWDTDGVEVYLDTKNASSNELVSGLHKLLININNETLLNRSSGSQWLTWSPVISYKVSTGLIKYAIELSIPWNELGGKPENSFGVHFKLHNNNGGTTTIVHENLSGGNPDRPRTWMKCTLTGSSSSSDRGIQANEERLGVYPSVLKQGEPFCIHLPEGQANAKITIYDAVSGRTVYNALSENNEHHVQGLCFSGVALVVVDSFSGKRFYNKMIMI